MIQKKAMYDACDFCLYVSILSLDTALKRMLIRTIERNQFISIFQQWQILFPPPKHPDPQLHSPSAQQGEFLYDVTIVLDLFALHIL